ncbi:MAG: serine/threonine protein kinase, partial [Clostridia bacterium]|nr:serine/threonine protein kinase [Clostridia bacterium]
MKQMDGLEKYVGAVFDNRYKIEKIIGIGGMAVVYKANDLLMHRTVAVKILRDEIAKDEASVKRFINESRAVSMLSHQNIVNIFDVSVRENVKYIVMEYVEGITLKNYMIKRGALPFEQLASYSEQILSALEHAHAKGIVHRDI